MTLSLYKQKRNFKNTPEPSETSSLKTGKLKFVIQKHDASHLHYDLRLELDGVLKSWAVPKGPSMDPSDKRLAVQVEDHPLDYGNFSGIIPEGNYGAGVVEIWDKGTYLPVNPSKINDVKLLRTMLKKGDIKFILNGHYLKGEFALVRMNDGKEKNWLLIKKKDEFAEENFNAGDLSPVRLYKKKSDNKKSSKASGINNTDLKKINKKSDIEKEWKEIRKPMLAKLSEKVVDDPDWLYEIKYDGYRAVSKINNGKAEMISRNGVSYNKLFTSLINELENVTDEVVLDGEVIIENKKGIPDFQLLQNYIRTKKGKLKYYVFDILFLNGHKLTGFKLLNRKELLVDFFDKYKFKDILLSEITKGNGSRMFKSATKKGYEGIIAKDMKGLYYPGKRTESWQKVKTLMQQEAIIAGYSLPLKSRKYFGSLILGIYENKDLKYIGNCGTGFTDESLKELYEKLKPIESSEMPFKIKPVIRGNKGKSVWVKPILVCDVKFSEWTNDGHMRHPVFNGIRNDKSAGKVMKESKNKNMSENQTDSIKEDYLTLNKKKVKATNLTKLYWKKEKISKGDLINYYINVSKFILPYLKNRPESLNRHPNGIEAAGFYQKDMNIPGMPEWLKKAKIYSKSNKEYIDYLICNDTATLVYMVNLGCIEINPWNSVYSSPDNPDYLILDLDPGKIGFKEVIKTALAVKELCDELELKCYCKTSGATGLHIYLPLNAKYDYNQVKTFAQILAEVVHSRLPDITSIERSVSKRKDKIYIDFLQNSKGQTIAAPYSVRPRPEATVSTPLNWKEVKEGLSPADFNIFNIMNRLKKTGDIWKGVLGKGIPMLNSLKKLEKLR
ncbi:MAG TPA: DNA ligase D [Ignavibacteria bacterium]|nr:DNA ligase D [Ignavibacteria bacterium]